ncbi:TrmH family RNA methyltransferase [Aureimonas ureilytica]|uniref:TrmH family RNA methyltransferase n=1 Tax=Aureimonas ureilytica TaxID=401562 RepID=UPI003CE82CAA
MRETLRIVDPADPRIEPFRAVRDRDVRGRDGFIGEGSVVLDQLARSTRFRTRALLILENRLEGLSERLAAFGSDVPIYVAGAEVFDAIAGFPVHRGVLAYGEPAPDPEEDWDRRLETIRDEAGVVVVACGLSNHDNMGALFRNADAFGAGAILLDERACDPLYRKAIRVSVGSVLTVPFRRMGAPDAIQTRLAKLGFECLFFSPGGAKALHGLRDTKPRALFLGTEGDGLDAALLARGETLRIAMAPGLDSLNVATSAAIALHHFFSLRQKPV